nr:hypothetical protein [Tanacetum cinerariifolium]
MWDKHLDTIPEKESDEFIKSHVKNLVSNPSESEDERECDVPVCDDFTTFSNLLLNQDSSIISSSKIDSILDDLPMNSFFSNQFQRELMKPTVILRKKFVKLNDLKQALRGRKPSGSTTTHSDISLSDYEAFYFHDDHIEEISSGSTTTHSDISLSEYDSVIFDFLNDQFTPNDRSDSTHEEFSDELAHIISPPEYDCFYFQELLDPDE